MYHILFQHGNDAGFGHCGDALMSVDETLQVFLMERRLATGESCGCASNDAGDAASCLRDRIVAVDRFRFNQQLASHGVGQGIPLC